MFWVACKNADEANYLLAIINSQKLYDSVKSLMPKGQFEARHLHKHLWKLPIPEFDPAQERHATIANSGATAVAGAEAKLNELREQRGDKLTVNIARRELRIWLGASSEGKAVETAVGRLLAGE